MKLFLSLLIMTLALIGLVYVLKPNKKKKKPQQQIPKKKTPPPLPQTTGKKTETLPAKSDKDEELPREPTMEEMRFAVRKYVSKFPGVTADVMQDWMKKP